MISLESISELFFQLINDKKHREPIRIPLVVQVVRVVASQMLYCNKWLFQSKLLFHQLESVLL